MSIEVTLYDEKPRELLQRLNELPVSEAVRRSRLGPPPVAIQPDHGAFLVVQ